MLKDVSLGVIGGTGFAQFESLKRNYVLEINTPWGKPSSPVSIFSIDDFQFAFIARHGLAHSLSPSEVPYQANIAALKRLGVRAIVAFTACGSLCDEFRPRDFVLPTQIIDRTYRRNPTLFSQPVVVHVPFAEPFDREMYNILANSWPVEPPSQSFTSHNSTNQTDNVRIGKEAQDISHSPDAEKIRLHTIKTSRACGIEDIAVICIEGPAFSTRAESQLYRNWGASVINMTIIPEAKLAREAEIAYQNVCMITDYDCWRENNDVSVSEIIDNLKISHKKAEQFLLGMIPNLRPWLESDYFEKNIQGLVSKSIQLDSKDQSVSPMATKMLEFLFGDLKQESYIEDSGIHHEP